MCSVKNSIDKFGRRRSGTVVIKRGPAGIGFHLTSDKHYDIQGKCLKNVGEPEDDNDSATRHYVNNRVSEIASNTLKAVQESADLIMKIVMESVEDKLDEIKSAITSMVNQEATLKEEISKLNHTVTELQGSLFAALGVAVPSLTENTTRT